MAAPRIDLVQPEVRHQIHYGQCLAGHGVEVAGEVVEPGGCHQVRVQLLVRVLAATATVLVVFHCDESRFRVADQTRDRPGVRVGLFEVVQRAMHEVLAHLFPCALVAQVVRRAHAVDWLRGRRLHLGGRGVARTDVADLASYLVDELLQARPQRERLRVPLPPGIHAGKASIVQLVADIQRQLQVNAERVAIADRNAGDGTRDRVASE